MLQCFLPWNVCCSRFVSETTTRQHMAPPSRVLGLPRWGSCDLIWSCPSAPSGQRFLGIVPSRIFFQPEKMWDMERHGKTCFWFKSPMLRFNCSNSWYECHLSMHDVLFFGILTPAELLAGFEMAANCWSGSPSSLSSWLVCWATWLGRAVHIRNGEGETVTPIMIISGGSSPYYITTCNWHSFSKIMIFNIDVLLTYQI